jgi:hypothetical protein
LAGDLNLIDKGGLGIPKKRSQKSKDVKGVDKVFKKNP